MSVTERRKAGRECRGSVPRKAHTDWSPAPDRPDPIDLLQQSDPQRLPDLLPIRYGRMLESPFAFLRGAAAVMAHDLAGTPSTGIQVQLAGDAHLANFGAYATPERNLVFGVNDFDETLPGPWEWDVKRLAASVMVAARSKGLDPSTGSAATAAAVRSYRERMAQYARMGHMALYYARIDADTIAAALRTRAQRKGLQGAVKKARSRDNLGALARLTVRVDGQLRIKDDPPLVTHVTDPELGDQVETLARRYLATMQADRLALLQRYSFVDAALKVVGVGSVGTRCFIVLLTGASEADPLFLQIKEAQASVLEPHLSASPWNSPGQRVVTGQRMIQAASDIFLGWGNGARADYYVRQLRDMKGSVSIATLTPAALTAYAALCGWALALAHARSGNAARIAGYLGRSDTFDRAVTAFATTYADQTERDHAALVRAVNDGSVPAHTGI